MDFEIRYVLIRDTQRITRNTSTPEHQPDHQKLIMAMCRELLIIRACNVYCPKVPQFSHVILFHKPAMNWPPVIIHTPIIPSWRPMWRISRFVGEGAWSV